MSIFHSPENEVIIEKIKERKEECSQIERVIQEELEWKKMEIEETKETAQKQVAPLLEQIQKTKDDLSEKPSKIITRYHDNTQDDQPLNLVQSIPDEILSLIFEAYVSGDQDPRILQVICHRWRRVSLSTPLLWTRIEIFSPADNPRPTWPYVSPMSRTNWGTSFQPCSTIEQVDNVASMAGSLDLHIKISSVETRNDFGEHNASKILEAVLGPQYSGRIVDLSIYLSAFNQAWVHGADKWLGKFPKLRSLRSRDPSHAPLEALIAARSTIRDISFPITSSIGSFPDTTWAGLRSLSITLWGHQRVFHQLLPKLSRIENIKVAPPSWPNSDTPSFILPSLREISLKCDPIWLQALTMPKLKTLHIAQRKTRQSSTRNTQGRDRSNKDRNLPGLEYLDVTSNGPSFLSRFLLPDLRTFRLSSECLAFDKCCKLFPFKGPSTLSEFILNGTCSTDAILDAIRKMPQLRVLKLEKYMGKEQAGLLDALAITAGPQVVCPKLEQIIFIFHWNWDFNDAEKNPGPYQRVMKERQGAGMPLRIFSLYDSDNTLCKRF
ncbi:hypothetical protein FRC14_005449 [Serendipita sp. 396]|nr:hypothetical protein FRC14_005449 [Serendipita sp. 396]KAG8780579.1 hypothetical protein FRC15_009478 [Serendipita sp. 397]KAG8797258.1 hypothetical protein FRC16_009079 [Serendipita sp. 398]KAG8850294.1 hypothetical protein FRB91_009157 [Serendipita sp. 411]KAG8865858.1 hypothetical protein FRC20_009424 [Serendipita sp. 405]